MLKPWRKGHCYPTANSQKSKNISLLAYSNSKYFFWTQNSFVFFFLSLTCRSLYKRHFSFIKLHITCSRVLTFVAWLCQCMSVNVRGVSVCMCVCVCVYTGVFSNISKSINLNASSSSPPQIKLLNLAWCPELPQSIWFVLHCCLSATNTNWNLQKPSELGINNITPSERGMKKGCRLFNFPLLSASCVS